MGGGESPTHTTKAGINWRNDQHTFEGDACCLVTDTKAIDGESLVLLESSLECDLGGKKGVVEADLGSPTPKKASLLETASPTECPEESPRPFPPSEPGWDIFWKEGRESSSLADGRRSEATTEGLIGRTSWDLRPGIISCVYCVEPVYGRDFPKGSRREFKVRVVGAWASERRGVGFRARYLLSESVPMQTVKRRFAAVELTGSHGQPCKCIPGHRLDVGERKERAWDLSSLVG